MCNAESGTCCATTTLPSEMYYSFYSRGDIYWPGNWGVLVFVTSYVRPVWSGLVLACVSVISYSILSEFDCGHRFRTVCHCSFFLAFFYPL
jgi:hypothetical protein